MRSKCAVATLMEESEDRDVYVGDLTTHAHFIASVLRQTTVADWLKQELDGYPEDQDIDVPYRRVRDCRLLAWRPDMGWSRAPINAALNEKLAEYQIHQGIQELEALDLTQIDRQRRDSLVIEFSEARQRKLRVETRLVTYLALEVPASGQAILLESLRGTIRAWAGALQAAGVNGEGGAFSKASRRLASEVSASLPELIATAHQHAMEQAAAPLPKKRTGLLARLRGEG